MPDTLPIETADPECGIANCIGSQSDHEFRQVQALGSSRKQSAFA